MDITKELTVIFPVRIDCLERKENLNTVLLALLKMTNVSIIILEADNKQRYFCPTTGERIKYVFVHDENFIFHRTHYLNQLLGMSETDVVGIWDTDVVLTKRQIIDATKAIKKGITLSYPYDGRFIFLDKEESNKARKCLSSFLKDKNEKDKAPFFRRTSVGGAFLVNKLRYMNAGGENEKFHGWGYEDAERFKRMEILEEPINRISGPLFHLYHPRGINSGYDLISHEKNNLKEFLHICQMNKEELERYIKTWNFYK
ncbi:MAG: galactosyltransferase-related protein [Fermentimonas sp.]|nr:galactosyltransferase-related protein [Fermentimonas sp.]MDD4439649.1 galactosyltransferase-related protein [Tissierellia bacterium]